MVGHGTHNASSFRFTKILAGEGGWRNQRCVLLTKYNIIYIWWDTAWQQMILEIYIKSIGITPNFFGLQTEVKNGHN